MRQPLTVDDEPYLLLRSLSVDYSADVKQPDHSHRWPQLLYATQGALQVKVNGELLVVPPRRGLWIPAHQPHELSMLGVVALRTLYCRPGALQVSDAASVFDVGGLLHELILRICERQWLDERCPTDCRLHAVAADELLTAPTHEIRLTMPVDPRALRLANGFLNLFSAEQSLSAACVDAGLSRRTAERIFQKETGLSPARWCRLARLSASLAYLAGGGSIGVATERAGYSNRSAFSSAFNRVFGFPPSDAGPGG